MKEHKIYAEDIDDFKEQLNEFFEANPTIEIRSIGTPHGIIDENGDLLNSNMLVAEILYE
ncbi:MAG: hypothetical protein R6U04_04545 [Bacteroidales bacterium]